MPLDPSYLQQSVGTDKGEALSVAVIRRNVFTDVVTADTNGYSEAHAGAGAAGTTDAPLDGVLDGVADVARNVVITVTHGSSVVAMSGTIYGTDINGKSITEAWSVTAGTTSKTFTGKKAFKTVTRITETVAADASTNTIIAGTGTVLGLDRKCAVASAVKEVAAGSVATNGTVVAASTAATDDAYGTYSPNTAPNDTNDYEVYFLVNDFWSTP